jgi:hypothetical protein|tara:strand:+ start:1878 stop:2354 length:477 start_codon:yes stop_codon:yes gene_type:complete
MLQINLVTKEVTRTSLPQNLKGLAQESLDDLSWTDPALGLENIGFWIEAKEESIPNAVQKYSGNETYRVDETNKCIYVTRELISQTSEEIKIVSDGVAEMAALDNRLLRNALLAETDWTGMSDVTMTSAMTTYRQALRDITAHADFPNLDDDDWPTKP